MFGKWAGMALAGLVLLSACKTKSELRREQELERLKAEVREVRGDRADLDAVQEELRGDSAKLSNRLEEVAHRGETRAAELKVALDAVTKRVEILEARFQEQADQERKAQEERSKSSLDNARKLIDEGQLEEGIDMLRVVLKQKGTAQEEQKRARFLLGETLFQTKDYASAALEFQEYRKIYPRDNLVPNAMYRQGLAFKSMGKPREAKLFLEELVEKFPKHPLASKARAEVRKLSK